MSRHTPISALVARTAQLAHDVDRLSFGQPVAHVYNPLRYAWSLHRAFLERYARHEPEVLFVGMNPGPWGMGQTGVPFGEVAAVRDWMGLEGEVEAARDPHPKRPVTGLSCPRSEVSGRRLWGWVAERFGSADAFFDRSFVLNHCPLLFLAETGRNLTPDKIRAQERQALLDLCDDALRDVVDILQPEWVIGVGVWAEAQARRALPEANLQFGRVLHPSPASPAANRGWAPQVEAQLARLGVLGLSEDPPQSR